MKIYEVTALVRVFARVKVEATSEPIARAKAAMRSLTIFNERHDRAIRSPLSTVITFSGDLPMEAHPTTQQGSNSILTF